MVLTHFEINGIGPMHKMQPPFARCSVSIGIWNEQGTLGAIDDINLNLVITHEDTDTLGTVKAKILEAAARVLREAARLLEGKDIQALYHEAADGESYWDQRPQQRFGEQT